ncbi:WAP four-disulfide core domain protein 1-like isoform X2 [Amphiura filiformis]|uniref:WAP four-disulfide core domain protein 1-like isoform X2 n=1 Tax=Amphiura filiformis TaxID=82378 RepID=UPI003B21B607
MEFCIILRYFVWSLVGVIVYGVELPISKRSIHEAAQKDTDVSSADEPKRNPECVPDHSQVHDIGTVYRHNLPESTESQHSGRCPPAPNELMPEACDVCMCWSDSQCGPDQKCCYNGCMQTCLHKVKPPPVLDWLIEPTRRPLIKGNTWLMPGPETQDTETCSTSIEDGVSPYNVLQDMCVPYRT